jgi:hypothetical protein
MDAMGVAGTDVVAGSIESVALVSVGGRNFGSGSSASFL